MTDQYDDLGAAWAEAEAALPEGWRLGELSNEQPDPEDPEQTGWTVAWCAFSTDAPLLELGGMDRVWDFVNGEKADDVLQAIYGDEMDPQTRQGIGPTPAAALRALAARMNEP